jgi:hypothetical protein
LALAVTRGSRSESAVALSTLGSHTIVRLNSFMLTFVPIAFGLGFAVFGIGAFIRTGNFQEQFEGKFQSIRAGKIQPEALTADRKYVDHGGKGVWPHVVFSSNRQPKVNIAVTIDFFNSANLGDTIPGYNFPDGHFIPQNHRGDPRGGKFFSQLWCFGGGRSISF